MKTATNSWIISTDERQSTTGVAGSLTRGHANNGRANLVRKLWVSRFVAFFVTLIAFVPLFMSVSLIVLFAEHSLFGPWLSNQTLLWSFGFAILASCCAAWMMYCVVKRWIMGSSYEKKRHDTVGTLEDGTEVLGKF
jgi:hypothetical protein